MAGQFEPLPRQCPPELGALIRRLLIVDTKQRPSCTDILQTSAVQSRMHLLPKIDNEGYGGHGGDDQFQFTKVDLLRQITTPKKPKDMRKYLPRARYGDFRAAEAAARGSPAMTEPAGPAGRNPMSLAAAQAAKDGNDSRKWKCENGCWFAGTSPPLVCSLRLTILYRGRI